MKKLKLTICSLLGTVSAQAAARFPHPDFESGYEVPTPVAPDPRPFGLDVLDTTVLALALCLAAYLVLKRRSRAGIVALMVGSLLYFGFFRRGCVCAIGAVQNVGLACGDSSYAIPGTVLLFFALPLVAALFWGRVFCAAVCPLGAAQDLVAASPRRLPLWLREALGVLPYVYLGVAVLAAWTGAAFLICRFDPFVGIFRLGAHPAMWTLTATVLAVGVFVARPYCRFLCPYGVLLAWASRLSRHHATITPDECIDCRLCEGSCPVDAIRHPASAPSDDDDPAGRKRLFCLLIALPALVGAGAFLGAQLAPVMARIHPRVRLAERIVMEEAAAAPQLTDATTAFRRSGEAMTSLHEDAAAIRRRFLTGGWLVGGFVGAVIGMRLILLAVYRSPAGFEPDRATCISCGRCFAYCPVEHARRREAADHA